MSVILSNGNDTFQARTDYPARHQRPRGCDADFNGDGFLDLAVTDSIARPFPLAGPSSISYHPGQREMVVSKRRVTSPPARHLSVFRRGGRLQWR